MNDIYRAMRRQAAEWRLSSPAQYDVRPMGIDDGPEAVRAAAP